MLLFVGAAQCQEISKPKSRAVSLCVMDATLRKGPSRQASKLCGITRVSGYVLDRSSRDIILVGKVDPAYPSLRLDDLVVALRNVRLDYATKDGRTYHYSSPGCSIDPDPAVIRQLQELGPRSSGEYREGDQNWLIEQWQAVGSQPQQVKVVGVPFDTHFAKVMVDADYYMKRLVNGTVVPGVPGFKSLMEMRIEQAEKDFQAGERSTLSGPSLNRFWFYPGQTTYEEGNDTVVLKDCMVKLLTEEEFLTSQGSMQGKGRPSPLAKDFAESFTRCYRDIASKHPIYRELEGMFRFTALAKLIAEKQALSRAGNVLEYLMKQHPVAVIPVSRKVNGLIAYRKLDTERPVQDGKIRYSLLLVSCGGVSMDVHPRRLATQQPTSTGKSGPVLREAVLASRTSRNALYWDIPALD